MVKRKGSEMKNGLLTSILFVGFSVTGVAEERSVNKLFDLVDQRATIHEKTYKLVDKASGKVKEFNFVNVGVHLGNLYLSEYSGKGGVGRLVKHIPELPVVEKLRKHKGRLRNYIGIPFVEVDDEKQWGFFTIEGNKVNFMYILLNDENLSIFQGVDPKFQVTITAKQQIKL